jgi:L-ascorbate metabolism protein UlaG (beta-lactamase superfamily)
MEIIWHGQGCFELRASTGIVITDPSTALRQPLPAAAATADIVSLSSAAITTGGDPAVGRRRFVIDRPGEFEAHGIFVISLETHAEGSSAADAAPNLVCCFDFPGLTVCHLGQRCDKLSQAQLDTLGNVHVLLLPIGGPVGAPGGTPGKSAASLAVEAVNQIDPAIVIPFFDPPGTAAEVPVLEQFLKEMGAADLAPRNQLRVDANRLPEEPQVALLGVAR